MKLDIQPFIFSWKGQFQKACVIEDQLRKIFPSVTVINSDDDNTRPGWINIGDAAYFGDQFRKALELFNGDVLFHIQADVEYNEWDKLVDDARFYLRFYEAGIYAPHVDYTHWIPERTDVLSDLLAHSHLRLVASTDETVWFVRKEVLEGIAERSIDTSLSHFGWGWCCSLSCISYSKGMPVIRDYRHTIKHPRGTGYNTDAAEVEMNKHIASLDEDLQKIYSYIRGDRKMLARYLKKEPEIPRVLGTHKDCAKGSIAHKRLTKFYNLSRYPTFVHVGTGGVDGVEWAGRQGFRDIHALLRSQDSLEEAQKAIAGKQNVRLLGGDSKIALAEICRQVHGPVLFYIDGCEDSGQVGDANSSGSDRTAWLQDVCANVLQYKDVDSSLIVVEDIPFKVATTDPSSASREARRTWLLEHLCLKNRMYATYLDNALLFERPT